MVGQLVDASNLALLSIVSLDGAQTYAMYKPVEGERPLWDFPDGTLAAREVASFLVSNAGGWGVVPPTVFREDGPNGPGSLQLWIGDPERTMLEVEPTNDKIIDIVRPAQLIPGWLPVFDARLSDRTRVVVAHADRQDLASTAVFDAVINNGDRKGSHLLVDSDGRVWGIDHGVTFNSEHKLRTVLWGWTGEPIGDEATEVLSRLAAELAGSLGDELHEHLTVREVDALQRRVRGLLAKPTMPGPRGDWMIPWPAF